MKTLKQNPYLVWVESRILKNKNFILIINGPTGSGKTYAGMRFAVDIANKLGTSFTIKNNMDFNFHGLLNKMALPENDKAGTVFLFEEVGSVGSGSASREWQSKANAFFFSFLQTSRHRNQILILTCPNFNYLEKGSRELCHSQWEMVNINPRKKVSTCKPHILQVNSQTGKIYFKYLRFKFNGIRHKFSRLELKLPPQDMVNEYEIIKRKFTDELNKRIMEANKPKEDMHQKSVIDDDKLKILLDKGVSNENMAKIFNCTTRTVSRRRANLAKKPKSKAIGPIHPPNVVLDRQDSPTPAL